MAGVQIRQFLLIAIGIAAAAPCFGATVKLTNGTSYPNVTIAGRDANSIQIETQYGRVNLPLTNIESIDGVSLHPTPAPAIAAPSPGQPSIGTAPVAPTQPQTAPAQPQTTPAAVPRASSAAPPAASGTAAAVTAETAPSDSPAPWPAYEHRWNMEAVLGGFAFLAALWVASAGTVQRSLYERRKDQRFWANAAIILPGIGWLAYQTEHAIAGMRDRKAARRSTNEVVANREKSAAKRRTGFKLLDEERKAILVKRTGEQSGLEHAQEVLEEALMERASDVHIDPAEEAFHVRFRIDGIMQPRMSYDRDEGLRIVSALKTLAQIDVAEKRKAQDGRFRVQTDQSDVDFRVATASSIFGEKVVIRILNRHSGLLGLEELGMAEPMREQFKRVIHSRSGMILATGPTGSGKTSTIYSALSQLDAARLNIMTIEDPVEYGLAGATQLPVNPKAGTTYESGLRSILRQDPDVIFVGEMRDSEAAQIALRAALTGHLVFSSLHTRDAIGTIIRLEEMGMDRHLLANSLLLVIAQRLVRVLCPHCREAYTSGADELNEIGVGMTSGTTIYRAKGCAECDDSGYIGRTGIFEMIYFNDEFRQAVNTGETEGALVTLARQNGFTSFREDGAAKVLQGITSIEEVLQAS